MELESEDRNKIAMEPLPTSFLSFGKKIKVTFLHLILYFKQNENSNQTKPTSINNKLIIKIRNIISLTEVAQF